MKRRAALVRFGALAGIAAFGRAYAQRQGKLSRIGFLSANRRPASLESHRFFGLVQGLRELGYIEGSNLAIEWRYAEDDYARLPALAAELVKREVDLIVAVGTVATRAAQKAASAIPIVMIAVGDPVGSGLVKSLARPGGRTTGLSLISRDLSSKWLEIARSVVPKLSRVGVLVNEANPARIVTIEGVRKAGNAIGVAVVPVQVTKAGDITAAFKTMKDERVGAVVIQNESMFRDEGERIAQAALQARLPTIAGGREFADAGCLAAYGPNIYELCRHTATYVDKIIRGAKPGDLPVEQPTSYELVLNLRSARALGLVMPQELVLRADRRID